MTEVYVVLENGKIIAIHDTWSRATFHKDNRKSYVWNKYKKEAKLKIRKIRYEYIEDPILDNRE